MGFRDAQDDAHGHCGVSDESGVLEKLFDETVRSALAEGLVSRHVSADGTLVRANASYKSFVPIEVAMDPEEYKKRRRAQDRATHDSEGPQDPGNRAVNFRGEKRSNATHRSTTGRDRRLASKGTTASGAIPGYTVNALMENRHRILLGIGVEIFRSSASETEGCKALLRRASQRYGYQPATLGADKGFFSEGMIEHLLAHEIEPHIAVERGSRQAHRRLRMRARGLSDQLSQRCRKKIEELFGEAKDWHGMRRFRRRGLFRIFEEALVIGWVLNLKRLATLLPSSAEPA